MPFFEIENRTMSCCLVYRKVCKLNLQEGMKVMLTFHVLRALSDRETICYRLDRWLLYGFYLCEWLMLPKNIFIKAANAPNF